MKRAVFSLALTSALASTMIHAKEEKHIHHSFPASANKLSVNFPVGSVEMITYQGNTVEVDVEIEQKDDKEFSWFSSDVDLSEIELVSNSSRDTLYLSIDEDDVNQKWKIKIPKQMAASIDLGVGEIEIDEFDNELNIDVGVGAVKVNVASQNFSSIELEAGVGDTDIEGFVGKVNERSHLVGSQSNFIGTGNHRLLVNVGVGDVEVRK